MPSKIVAPLDDSLYGMGGFDQSLINSELTRTIRDEVSLTDKSINVTKENIKNEQLSFSQLTKQCNHARDEMYKRRRDAEEVVQSESTMEDCRVSTGSFLLLCYLFVLNDHFHSLLPSLTVGI